MKIACLSDTHGEFPTIPDCDLLLLGGDYCPIPKKYRHMQLEWFQRNFVPWINYISKKTKVIGIAGNHDFLFQDYPDLVPEMNWTYLQDSGTIYEGLNIWGTPWQLEFYDWAFNLNEDELKQKYDLIPNEVDIIISHGPPFGFGDYTYNSKTNVGSKSLTDRIENIQPKLLVFGHIHEGYGQYEIGKTKLINASYYNSFQGLQPVQVIEI